MEYITSDSPSYEAVTKALFENYECIYDIDVESGAYQCCYESEPYKELLISSSGEDFFASLAEFVPKVIHPEDRKYVLHMLQKDTILSELQKEKYYSFVYRLIVDDNPVYHKIRATREILNGREHFLLGVRNVDETIKEEQMHSGRILSMYQKEKNHMEAILGSAAGYLEVNLTKDDILELSPYLPSGNVNTAASIPREVDLSKFSSINEWLCKCQISKGLKKFREISDRNYLINCYLNGEKRASVSFSSYKRDGSEQPCKEVFYLYQDDTSGDIMAFCVIYDLTEQQRKEKEMKELETELQLSRIRNFTSQMQPHFLYNALGSIQEVMLEDPKYASSLLDDFAIHLRSCIRSMTNDRPIPFFEELENVKAYINIEKMRFGDKLEVEYDIQAKDFNILPLSIQPLVENSIRHGIYERGLEGGKVLIQTRETPDSWQVIVEDSGMGFDTDIMKKNIIEGKLDSTGLRNINFRLDKILDGDLHVSSIPGKGTVITVTIPKKEHKK